MIVWKAIISYGAGYRVQDDKGVTVAQGLNSYHVMQEAILKAYGKDIKFEYYSEETTELEPTQPFGPES